MTPLKNSEIARKYSITKTTVANYILDAQNSKNNLECVKIDKKVQLIDSPKNTEELERLVTLGRKFRPTTSQKTGEVNLEFYQLFNQESQFEIFRDLEIEKQIDLKYYYYKEGAEMWSNAIENGGSGITFDVANLIARSISEISGFFKSQKFNLIDVGCGNGQPADILIKTGQVDEYIAYDISSNLLEITQKNIRTNFPNQKIITEEFDFQKDSISKKFTNQKNKSHNLFGFIGNTICNLAPHERSEILNAFSKTMDKNDMVLISYSLDTVKNRKNLSYVRSMLNYWLPQMIGIDTQKVVTEVNFNTQKNCKELGIVLDKSYLLDFYFKGNKQTIYLNQGDKINLWKHYLFTLENIVKELDNAKLKPKFIVSNDNNVLFGCQLSIED